MVLLTPLATAGGLEAVSKRPLCFRSPPVLFVLTPRKIITDVRTAVPYLAGICPCAAAASGHVALFSEAKHDAKWMR
jgi:hypothetical protein